MAIAATGKTAKMIGPKPAHKSAPVKKVTLKRNHSADQRANLKRAYQAFVRASKKAGNAAAQVLSPSESWPMRPYAASI
ncbi:hypothetical protein [Collinsella tanakaei]|uniref:hypothetical protein n=1 Tax=Collinsella tanakaei TaxID=626935 RepID=UPI0026EFC83C|nr:hypothetical protein [Collinsella tanakaei]